jgi:hypothetical protein
MWRMAIRWVDAPRHEAVSGNLGGEWYTARLAVGEVSPYAHCAAAQILQPRKIGYEIVGPTETRHVPGDLEAPDPGTFGKRLHHGGKHSRKGCAIRADIKLIVRRL